MNQENSISVAIVDFGLGNLFSVKQACQQVGMHALTTSSHQEITQADAIILPGVGAFGDAMAELKKLGLVNTLKDIAFSQKPLIGICLGMQLLMSEGSEFGHHEGLGIIKGVVARFEGVDRHKKNIKVPHIGWNKIFKNGNQKETLLDKIKDGDYMYFVHSYYVKPENKAHAFLFSRYETVEFCSGIKSGNTIAFQFHPERSGSQGLTIYKNLASFIYQTKTERNVP